MRSKRYCGMFFLCLRRYDLGRRSMLLVLGVALAGLPHALWAAKGNAEGRQSLSAEQFIDSEAGKFFQEGDYQKALDALERLQTTYPEDPLLRRYRAIALDRLGRSQEAITIFQQLLEKNPSHLPTRYFLGQAYYRMGNHRAAIEQWQWVAERGRTTPYRSWALRSLERAGQVRMPAEPSEIARWYVTARYGYEYDSNVVLRPDDKSLAKARDQNAGRQAASVDLRYRFTIDRDTVVDLHYTVRQTIHDDSLNEFNFHSEEVGLDIRRRFQIRGRDYVAGLRYDLLVGFLEDDLFSVRNQWLLRLDTRFTQHTRTVFFSRLAAANYAIDGVDPPVTSRDGFYEDIGVTHYWHFSGFRRYVFARQEFHSSHTRGRNFDTVGTASRLGFHTPLVAGLELDVSGGLEIGIYHRFSSLSAGDTSRRRDLIWDVYAALNYPVTPSWTIRGFYRYIAGENQNNFFDYTRHIGGVQVVYTFSS